MDGRNGQERGRQPGCHDLMPTSNVAQCQVRFALCAKSKFLQSWLSAEMTGIVWQTTSERLAQDDSAQESIWFLRSKLRGCGPLMSSQSTNTNKPSNSVLCPSCDGYQQHEYIVLHSTAFFQFDLTCLPGIKLPFARLPGCSAQAALTQLSILHAWKALSEGDC